MTVHEVWEKYKHMDPVLSVGRTSDDSFFAQIVLDLWAAIKNEIEKGKGG